MHLALILGALLLASAVLIALGVAWYRRLRNLCILVAATLVPGLAHAATLGAHAGAAAPHGLLAMAGFGAVFGTAAVATKPSTPWYLKTAVIAAILTPILALVGSQFGIHINPVTAAGVLTPVLGLIIGAFGHSAVVNIGQAHQDAQVKAAKIQALASHANPAALAKQLEAIR